MPIQASASTENNFIEGLRTEFTGLNFPENAMTDAKNSVISLIGETTRRGGFDFEKNFAYTNTTAGVAYTTYRWKNVGGDGLTQILVVQNGSLLLLYRSSTATAASPLSTQRLSQAIDLTVFTATGGSFDTSLECQFTDGNGYLIVFHPSCDPFYLSYNAGTLDGARINVQIRDFVGVPDGLNVTYRPLSLSAEHQYNLFNQGWSNYPSWSTTSSSTVTAGTGPRTFTISAGLAINNGDPFTASAPGTLGGSGTTLSGTVSSYSGTTLGVTVTSFSQSGTFNNWTIVKAVGGLINTWAGTVSNYPSNSDVWWLYKAPTGVGGTLVFDPLHTVPTNAVAQPQAQATQGAFILNAFNQQRSLVSGVGGITDVTTLVRPRTGTWFEGRVWFAGVDANFPQQGDQPFSTWTENIYFSQIVTDTSSFGQCYQANDPTSENFFDLLPTDGGVITIQGCGSIYKLFPIVNGMLVFAANGIWFITGSQGIGFRPNDYTITKIPGSPRCISGTSFVNLNGWPMFWNEEGIYMVQHEQNGFKVENLCIKTILSFYNTIPLKSKMFARGDFDPVSYVVQWLYRTTNETGIADRYSFDGVLNLNIANKSFYTYTIEGTTPTIKAVNYVESPGGSTAPDPVLKYLTATSTSMTFSEEKDITNFFDFKSYDGIGVDFDSYFITGYRLRPKGHPYLGMYGQAPQKYQPIWVYMWSNNEVNTSYKIQGFWEFALTGNSGKVSNTEVVNITNDTTKFGKVLRRHKLRGHGRSFQIKVSSVSGKPFQIMGWSVVEAQNVGV